ncbi:MAG TPA: putative DNA-binding domain-containing protein, partial [Pseudomonas sp.]|nr:putative DNA-binding domain-containing protein [Pseudomonas sp.]
MDKASLVQQQTTMGLYLRDPEHNAPPTEMDPARAQVYRDLVFANLSSLLSGTFPVLVKILGEEHWRSLVRIFLRDYRARTPKFGEIAQEFVEFLASEPLALVDGPWPPFMVELAHYEWVEMALQQSDAEPVAAGDASLLLDRPLQVSPLAWPLAYAWPVQLLGPDYQPDVLPAQPTLLLVRRAEDWGVKFSELSPLAWRLLLLVGEFPELTGRELLQGLAVEAGAGGSLEFLEGGVGLLRQMHGE